VFVQNELKGLLTGKQKDLLIGKQNFYMPGRAGKQKHEKKRGGPEGGETNPFQRKQLDGKLEERMVDAIIKRLGNWDWEERDNALGELIDADIKDEKIRRKIQQALLARLGEPDEDVRYRLYRAIGKYCDGEALQALERHYKIARLNTDDPTVSNLKEAIEKIRKRSGKEPAKEFYDDSPLARWNAIGELLADFFEYGMRSPFDGVYAYMGVKAKRNIDALNDLGSIASFLPFDHNELGVNVFEAIKKAYNGDTELLSEVQRRAA